MIDIKCRFTGKILFSHEGPTLKLAVEAAVKALANLDGANLAGANLAGANLDWANLAGASLDRANLAGANLDGANLARANLDGASLDGANLDGASLDGASLDGASLDDKTILPTAVTFKEYKEEVLPQLLVAGGKTIDSYAEHWTCHNWDNCPMAHCFDIRSPAEAPALYRGLVAQFVQLFDAGLLPTPLKPEQ